jgi:hypothetical protein
MLPPMLAGITLYGGNYMILDEWKIKNRNSKSYSHFDKRVTLRNIWNYISDPKKVKSHSFYPLIHYTINLDKYNKAKGVKHKKREISYSAHIDRFIFSYYGFKLNQLYNSRVVNDGIDNCAIAYRDNKGKCNIHYAKQAIKQIRNTKKCFIIVGDFTNFFDSLEHKYLKQMLCNLLGVSKIPDDYYAVFKNITKYSKWDMESLLQLNKLKFSKSGIKSFNELGQALPLAQFKKLKKQSWMRNIEGQEVEEKYLISNPGDFGIPQGSAISAVLSNIYMLDFDKQINIYIQSKNGLYMRYCDDFIIILPITEEAIFKKQFDFIRGIIRSIPNINLQSDKTQIYEYDEEALFSRNDLIMGGGKKQIGHLHYLGFTFDGKVVTIRDKTISKYYYRMYRKLNNIVKSKGVTKKGNIISCKELYEKYTIKGIDSKKGNFLSYVNRAKGIWDPNEKIERGTKYHLQKIRKRLNKMKDMANKL